MNADTVGIRSRKALETSAKISDLNRDANWSSQLYVRHPISYSQ